MDKEMRDTKPEGYRWTWGEMHDAFTAVADKEHWKNPIDAVVSEKLVDILRDAIPFFTGSIPEFFDRDENGRPYGDGKVCVVADGYFVAIGA